MAVARKLPCEVARIEDHGDHVYTVDLRPAAPVPRFRPGQFLHLAIDQYDPSSFWPDSRVFSIASLPSDRDRLRIVYSVRGRFTARMERELAPGRGVWAKLPFGDFVIDPARPAVLFAGGTGISAFATYIGSLSSASPPTFVAYGARTPGLLIYRKTIERQAARLPSLRYTLFCESPVDGAITGRISPKRCWADIGALGDCDFYISGPPAMTSNISAELCGRDVAAGRVKVDAWE
jgi:ferredoxin-NADP reductase